MSNSSSSSFVVVPDDVVEKFKKGIATPTWKIRELFNFSFESEWFGYFWDAECWFDLQWVNYHNAKDKWNWLVLQAHYAKHDNDDKTYCKLLNEYLKSIGCEKEIEWGRLDAVIDNMSAWIDRQSIDAQDTFDEVKKVGIDEFLANERCYICNESDNAESETPEERY